MFFFSSLYVEYQGSSYCVNYCYPVNISSKDRTLSNGSCVPSGMKASFIRKKKRAMSGSPSGVIRQNWNDTEKISMAPAQGWHAQIEKCNTIFFYLRNGWQYHICLFYFHASENLVSNFLMKIVEPFSKKLFDLGVCIMLSLRCIRKNFCLTRQNKNFFFALSSVFSLCYYSKHKYLRCRRIVPWPLVPSIVLWPMIPRMVL